MSRIVFLDFETYPINGQSFIMEIGCVAVTDGHITDHFQTLVKPETRVTDFVLKLTGIAEFELNQAKPFTDIIFEFHQFVKNAVVVAHNAPLDQLSYVQTCAHYDIQPQVLKWVDSQDIFKILVPTTQTLQLQALLTSFGVSSLVKHRAYEDALGLAELMLHMRQTKTAWITAYEVKMLKRMDTPSMALLIRFLVSFFVVEAPPVEPVSYTRYPEQDQSGCLLSQIEHMTDPFKDLMSRLDRESIPTIMVTHHHLNPDYPFVFSLDQYVYPPKISQFYPLIESSRASHIEVVEWLALIHWLRRTKTFCLQELNENLRLRFHRKQASLLPVQPYEKIQFLVQLLDLLFQESSVVECHADTFQWLVQYAHQSLTQYRVLFYNVFSTLPIIRHGADIKVASQTYLPLNQLVQSLSTMVTHSQQSVFVGVKEVARLRYCVDILQEERAKIFEIFDHLMSVLSANIYNNTRQVWVNTHVKETLEWQRLLGHFNVSIHYLDTLYRILDRVGQYIDPNRSDWVRDAMIYIQHVKKGLLNIVQGNSNQLIYIESNIKHRPSNCQLVFSIDPVQSIFNKVLTSARHVAVHQPVLSSFPIQHMDAVFGYSVSLKSTLVSSECVEFVSQSQSKCRQFIEGVQKNQVVYLIFSNAYQMKRWRQLLYSVSKGRRHTLFFISLDRIGQTDFKKGCILMFPQVESPNMFQPVFQYRLRQGKMEESELVSEVFAEHVHHMMGLIWHLDFSRLIFNIESV